MPFEKGVSGNKNGRPAGSKNKTTQRVRNLISDIIEDEADNLRGYIDELDKKDRAEFLIKLLPFVLPRLNSSVIDIADNQKEAPIRPSWFNEE
jgi:hypothetical protein